MPVRTGREDVIGLVLWLGVCIGAAAVGAVGSSSSAEIYGELARPDWAPPAWLFGPVWSVLYVLMGVAAWSIWRMGPSSATGVPLALFVVQLSANALWTWLFFRWQLGGWALAEILVLWLLIAATTVAFWRLRPLASALLMPYLAWVAFAAALNWALLAANPDVLG